MKGLCYNTSKSQDFQAKQNIKGAKMWRKKILLTHKHQPRIPVKDEHDKDYRTIYRSKKAYIEGKTNKKKSGGLKEFIRI